MGTCCSQDTSVKTAHRRDVRVYEKEDRRPKLPLIPWKSFTSAHVVSTGQAASAFSATDRVMSSAIAVLPVELLALVVGCLDEYEERMQQRLVCKRWHCAVTCLLEGSLSAWIRRGSMRLERSHVKNRNDVQARQIVCALPGMSSGVLDSIKRLDLGGWNSGVTDQVLFILVSFFGARLNETLDPETTLDTDSSQEGSLHTLWLHGCENITDEAAIHIVQIQSLESVDAFRCVKLTDNTLRAWSAGLPNLTSLTLTHCKQITDTGLRALATHKSAGTNNSSKLRFLDLSYCGKITDEGVRSILKLPQLQLLSLRDCSLITDEGLAEIAQGMGNLRHLTLTGCTNISDVGLEALSKRSTLMSLNISFCTKVSDRGVKTLARLPQLGSLSLAKCRDVTDSGMTAVIERCELLHSMELAQCDLLTDKSVIALSGRLQLQLIDLSGCVLVTDEGVKSLAQLQRLFLLNLSWCPKITDASIIALCRSGHSALRNLNLYACDKLTDAILDALMNLPDLTSLDLSRCPRISARAVETLKGKREGLRVSCYK